MPLRKPPRKLFDLSLEAFAFYVVSNIENIEVSSPLRVGRNSSFEIPNLSKLSVRGESRNGRSESEALLTFKDKQSHLILVPSSLYDEILSKILQLLPTKQILIAKKASIFLLLEKVFTFFMTEDLKNLDLNPLIGFLKCYNAFIRPVDASVIGSAKNLVSFSLTDICDDSILYIISKNCSQLEYVNIAHSKQVTDSGVSALAPSSESSGCQKLRELIIHGCQVSVPVVSTLLKRLLDIEYIGYSKMHDVLLDFIKEKDGYEVNSTRTLKLTQLTICDISVLRDIGILCPNLQYLDIRMREQHDRFIACLKDFPHISQLFLRSTGQDSHFPSPNIREYFSTTNASKLTSLTICYKTFESAYLLFLGEQCPNLTELQIQSNYLLYDRNLKIKDDRASYKKLSVFLFELDHIGEENSDVLLSILHSVLKNTKILKRLSLMGSNILTDESFQNLLSHINTHSLVDLNIGEEAYVRNTETVLFFGLEKRVPLTMSSVHFVLDKCLRLKVLSGLNVWRVDMSDIEQLQKDLTASNYDIQLSGRSASYVKIFIEYGVAGEPSVKLINIVN